MLHACRNSTFTQLIDGVNVTSPFDEQAVHALERMGPAGCAYHLGYDTCDEQICGSANVGNVLDGCADFFKGVQFEAWRGCVDKNNAVRPEAERQACWAKYVNISQKCSGCQDLETPDMLRKIAIAASAKECQTLSSDGNCRSEIADVQRIADSIEQICCAGADGVLGSLL